MKEGFEECNTFIENSGSSGDGGGSSFDRHSIDRFYIHPNDKNEKFHVILLDDNPVGARVHNYPLPLGSSYYGNWITCPKHEASATDCFLCDEIDNYASKRTHFTVLNATGFEDSDGNHQMRIQILPATEEVFGKLRLEREEHGRLSGALFKVVRLSDNNALGNWEFQKFVDLDKFVEKDKHQKALKKSIEYFPKEYGLVQDDGSYTLRRLPLKDVLEPLSPSDLRDYIKQQNEMHKQFNSGGGGGSSTDFDYGENNSSQDQGNPFDEDISSDGQEVEEDDEFSPY